jgi:hypothetical protein
MSPLLDKWKKIALSLAIVVVLNVFFNVGIETFYPTPVYEDFCPLPGVDEKTMAVTYPDMATCNEAGGQWTQPAGEGAMGFCDYYGDCYKGHEEAMQIYNRNAFVILTILGTATLLFGLLTHTLPMAVANGLLFGGVVTLLIGTMRYWNYMEDHLRFIVSGVALALLIFVGIKRLKD